MSHLIISKRNEVYLHIQAEPHIYYELKDAFQFDVPNAKFSPAYKNKWWDGKIFLFNVNSGEIYVGLLDKLISFCRNHNYTYEFRDNKYYGLPFEVNKNISKEGIKDYLNSICSHTPREYQVEGVFDALRHNRKLLISPTASGKSLMIYGIVRYYVERQQNILIVVPTTSLCYQMYKDFEEYGFNSEKNISIIMGGKEKNPKIKKVSITLENGEKKIFNLNDKVKTKRGIVLAKDLNEDDLIL